MGYGMQIELKLGRRKEKNGKERCLQEKRNSRWAFMNENLKTRMERESWFKMKKKLGQRFESGRQFNNMV